MLLLFIVRIKGIKREREILVSSVRMTLQLVLTGYILMYIFESSSPLYTLIILSVMQIFAVQSVISKFKSDLTPELKKSIFISMFSVTMICLIYYITVVIRVSPWYEARYIITIAGMIIGNSMTAVSSGLNSLIPGMRTEKSTVEGALMLGASPKASSKHIIDMTRALRLFLFYLLYPESLNFQVCPSLSFHSEYILGFPIYQSASVQASFRASEC